MILDGQGTSKRTLELEQLNLKNSITGFKENCTNKKSYKKLGTPKVPISTGD